MKISIIISFFNEEKYINDCIKSLLLQSYKDIEIILVDDGSTDNSSKIVNDNFLRYKNIFLYQKKHAGVAECRNFGVSKSSGKIVVFLDADMEFDKDFIKNLIKPIINKTSNGTFSKEEYVLNWENKWARCWNINQNYPEKKRHPKDYPDTQKVFRAILKSEFIKVNGFDKTGYTDDYTLSEKLGYLAINAKGAIFYHKNPESLIEIFNQAKWMSKRSYKLNFIGKIYSLFRSSLFVSLPVAFIKSSKNKNFNFLIFKIIFDFGFFCGILENIFYKKLYK